MSLDPNSTLSLFFAAYQSFSHDVRFCINVFGLSGGIVKAMLPSIATDATAGPHDPSVCLFVTLVHPAKAVGQNEMPFSRDTRVVPSNIVSDEGLVSPTDGQIFGGRNPPVCCDATHQITFALL